uniref:NADH dehydrogenase subunit 6 n=1 Tax=Pheidole oxyops TaxID=615297 RepID=A0A343YVN8_9HYME|nr:NADH dehydrogenase subunit 6 [Pheidole oxyops]
MTKIIYLQIFLLLIILNIFYLLSINSLHPIFILILIIIYSSIICFLMSIWANNFIYSIMLFLIMISGMLIMFLYFSSLISNNQTKLSFNIPLLTMFLLNLLPFTYLLLQPHYPIHTFNEISPLFMLNNNLFNNILNIYSHPYSNITLICILYLLLTLFSIIKMCSLKPSTLRKLM